MVLCFSEGSSTFIIAYKNGYKHKVNLCKEGTFDYKLIMKGVPIYVETKSTKGKLRKVQMDWAANIVKHGAVCIVIRDIKTLSDFLCTLNPEIKDIGEWQ